MKWKIMAALGVVVTIAIRRHRAYTPEQYQSPDSTEFLDALTLGADRVVKVGSLGEALHEYRRGQAETRRTIGTGHL